MESQTTERATENRANTRKKYIINPEFQWKMIRWMAALSAVTSLIYLASNYVFFMHLKEMGMEQKLPPDALYFKFLEQQEWQMGVIFLITTAVSVAIIVGFGVFASHRIAGPIYRMCQHLRSTDPQRHEQVKFRKGDFFPELADSFNHFTNQLKK